MPRWKILLSKCRTHSCYDILLQNQWWHLWRVIYLSLQKARPRKSWAALLLLIGQETLKREGERVSIAKENNHEDMLQDTHDEEYDSYASENFTPFVYYY